MISLHTEKLRNNQESTWLIVDVIMLVLLMANLTWLIFDWLFAADVVAGMIEGLSPRFHAFYRDKVHAHFFRYDLVFVTLFLLEFSVRWVVSVRRRTYERWYWYPFIHWYELLGCIPLTGFRLLRLLRIISMLYRLQRLGVINLAETRVAVFLWRYYQVFLEEVSDRVVLNVLTGMQNEISHGGPVGRQIVNDVVVPRKDLLVDELGQRLAGLVGHNYGAYRDDIHRYVEGLIAEAVKNSEDIKRFERIPLLGSYAIDTLERSVSDIVFNVINRAMDDLHSADNRTFIRDVLDVVFDFLLEEQETLDQVSTEMLVDVLEVIKERVRRNRAVDRLSLPLSAEQA